MSGAAPVPAAIVFAGSRTGRAGGARVVAGRRRRDRRRLRARRRRRRSACTSTISSATSTRSTPAAVEAADAAGTTVDRHPAEKDATDLELALDAAVARGARRVVVVDGGGDRLDHLLGNLLLLASPAFAGVAVEAFCGTARIAVARGGDPPVTISGRARQLRDACCRSAVRRAASSPTGCAIRCATRSSRRARRAASATSSPRDTRLGRSSRPARCSWCSRSEVRDERGRAQ